MLIGQHEGLPNITGHLGGNQDVSCSRAFYRIQYGVKNSGHDPYAEVVGFSASLGETKTDGTLKNDVYGKSDHLQTNNITVKYWKRVA